MKTADPKTTAGRAFVRSLNILLKFARLYGYEHVRTAQQLETAWNELRTAIPLDAKEGLLLAVSSTQLLLDGVPLEGSPAEKQFAQLLSAAGVGSVQFFASITQEELQRFVHAFPTGKSKPADLAEQLKAALATAQSIRINEICFVATDSRMKGAGLPGVAAQLAAATLGQGSDQLKSMLSDPQKLLEIMAAAQGSHGSSDSGTAAGNTSSEASHSGAHQGVSISEAAETGTSFYASSESIELQAGYDPLNGVPERAFASAPEPSEAAIYKILTALTTLAGAPGGSGGSGGPGELGCKAVLQDNLSHLPADAQGLLKHALAELAAKAPGTKPDDSVLIQLAEHLAIRFALERFERGEVRVNAVRQMLDRMNHEIENLRSVLGARENQLSQAGLFMESQRDILDRQFWTAVPEKSKRAVLLSEDAWCIPPRNIQSYVNDLVKHGNTPEAVRILQNYAACAESEDADARKRSALGLSQLADLYANLDPKLLGEALRHLGTRLAGEQDPELQGLVSAAFVRFTKEAATARCYPAVELSLNLIAGVEAQRPGIARSLRDKMGIEEHVAAFLEEALRAKQAAAGLTNILRMLPQTAMELLAARLNRCSLRNDAEHIANLALDLGEEGVQYLRSTLRGGSVEEAVEMIGLLSKLDPQAVETFLPARIKNFPRTSQDRVVRQLSACGAPGRCRILLGILDHTDPLVMPLIIDEIGVTADREALGRLMNIVDGDLPAGATPYLRVKAAEALGRIHGSESLEALKRVVMAKKVFGWLHPQELRIAALQALEKLDPEWVREFLPKSGLDKADLILAPLGTVDSSKFVRQRRHTRVRLNRPLTAVSLNLKNNCHFEIKTVSLSGGVASVDRHLAPGTQVQLRMQIGLRNLQATAFTRDYRAQGMAFEFVDMDLEERGKFRRLLADSLSRQRIPATGEVPALAAQ
jgi:hypothetical protein